MEKKYIIELKDNTAWLQWVNVVEDGTVYFDYKYPEDLTPYTEPGTNEAYQRGMEDAWKAARTLWNAPNRKEVFGHTTFNTVITTLTAQEAIEKIRQYEQRQEEDKESCQDCQFAKNPKTQEPCGRCSHSFYNFFRPKEQKKEEIKVGDEVLYEDEKGVVIVPEENGHYAAAFTAGGMRICEPDYKLRKTGKHYPEIVKILQEMRKK